MTDWIDVCADDALTERENIIIDVDGTDVAPCEYYQSQSHQVQIGLTYSLFQFFKYVIAIK